MFKRRAQSSVSSKTGNSKRKGGLVTGRSWDRDRTFPGRDEFLWLRARYRRIAWPSRSPFPLQALFSDAVSTFLITLGREKESLELESAQVSSRVMRDAVQIMLFVGMLRQYSFVI